MTTDIKLVRALIPDTDAVFGAGEDEYIFSDADIENYLTVARGNVLRAAGYAMIAVGNSEALISKVIQSQDLKTNGAAVQNQWRQAGQALLLRADNEDAEAAADYFEIIDYREGWSAGRPELTERGFSWV